MSISDGEEKESGEGGEGGRRGLREMMITVGGQTNKSKDGGDGVGRCWPEL